MKYRLQQTQLKINLSYKQKGVNVLSNFKNPWGEPVGVRSIATLTKISMCLNKTNNLVKWHQGSNFNRSKH